jgi:hypothetical protein
VVTEMLASQILSEFFSLARQIGENQGFSCQQWRPQVTGLPEHYFKPIKNIVKFSGSINCLAYIKVCSGKKHSWGITENRIRKLEGSGEDWVVILLYETPNTGYLLSADDVDRGSSAWTVRKDGDYKVNPGNIDFYKPFTSFQKLIDQLYQTLQYK